MGRNINFMSVLIILIKLEGKSDYTCWAYKALQHRKSTKAIFECLNFINPQQKLQFASIDEQQTFQVEVPQLPPCVTVFILTACKSWSWTVVIHNKGLLFSSGLRNWSMSDTTDIRKLLFCLLLLFSLFVFAHCLKRGDWQTSGMQTSP